MVSYFLVLPYRGRGPTVGPVVDFIGPPWDTSLGFSPRSLRSLGEARHEFVRSLARLKTLTRRGIIKKNSGTTSVITLLIRLAISIAIFTPGKSASLAIPITKSASKARRLPRRPSHLRCGILDVMDERVKDRINPSQMPSRPHESV